MEERIKERLGEVINLNEKRIEIECFRNRLLKHWEEATISFSGYNSVVRITKPMRDHLLKIAEDNLLEIDSKLEGYLL